MNNEREIMTDKITISPEKALESPLVNKAELARQMFPNNKNAKAYLSDKLAGRQHMKFLLVIIFIIHTFKTSQSWKM